ncbi:hypothetical protein GW17_00013815 [Ensete ventricosum]|nr:hypothetical protein GW17_00013815 [Ensete ventricosum]
MSAGDSHLYPVRDLGTKGERLSADPEEISPVCLLGYRPLFHKVSSLFQDLVILFPFLVHKTRGMEEGLRGVTCPQLLDLMPNKRDWIVKDDGRGGKMKASQLEVESLELRLGLPAAEEEKDPSGLSLARFYKSFKTTTTTYNKNHHCAGSKRGFFGTFESRAEGISSQMFAFLDGFRFVYHILLFISGPQQQKTSGGNLKDELHQSQERKAAHEVPEHASAASMNSQTR